MGHQVLRYELPYIEQTGQVLQYGVIQDNFDYLDKNDFQTVSMNVIEVHLLFTPYYIV